MVRSNIGNQDTPYYRMERAILRLVRGSLYRRLSVNEREAFAIEAKVYTLVQSIMDLHHFRDRRILTIRYRDRQSNELIGVNEKIIAEIVANIQIVKEEILYHPFERDVHMDFILTSLDKIVDRHTASECPLSSKSIVKREVVSPVIREEEVVLGNTDEEPEVVKPQSPTMKVKKKENPFVQRSQINTKKNQTPSLPKLTTFLTANVGSILYEQGEYADTGTLNKGESIHEREQFRAN
ncbi:hypothetical protein [Paenibacillus agilis]|uniref:Uncharacterized protein n=1 Tax=Paenibacillus agilis TaxID=3020863 RepID=A0A559J2G6_9BACL|nr:hypothetical protein [Paenibacillus agilis]TVX94078.1 hypothetical protein FPZ44_14055 [Paenibacillus agilis]